MIAFEDRRNAALEILRCEARLTRKAGSFLGQCAVDASPLTDKQVEWFGQLASRAGVEVEGLSHEA